MGSSVTHGSTASSDPGGWELIKKQTLNLRVLG